MDNIINNGINKSRYNREDKKICNFIIAYFFMQALNLFVKLVIGEFAAWSMLSKGILAVMLILAIQPILQRALIEFIFIEFVFILSLGYTFFFEFAKYGDYKSHIFNLIVVFIPMGLAMYALKDKSILFNRMYIMSWPTQVILLIVMLNMSSLNYSMVSGYALVFQSILVIQHFVEKKKWYDLVAVVIDIAAITIYGSRGPLLCVLAFIVLKVISFDSVSKKKRIIAIPVIMCIAVALVSLRNAIIRQLIAIASSLGYKSRNLELILNNNVFSDSGRSAVHQYYETKLMSEPVFGYGIFGNWMDVGLYPHNIVIELLYSYGIIFGIIALMVTILVTMAGLFSKNENEKRLAHICFAYCISLLLSDSFLMCPIFFLMMALGLNAINGKITFNFRKVT